MRVVTTSRYHLLSSDVINSGAFSHARGENEDNLMASPIMHVQDFIVCIYFVYTEFEFLHRLKLSVATQIA